MPEKVLNFIRQAISQLMDNKILPIYSGLMI
jgi:hypothetical protein